jgi:hypothetical protein
VRRKSEERSSEEQIGHFIFFVVSEKVNESMKSDVEAANGKCAHEQKKRVKQ